MRRTLLLFSIFIFLSAAFSSRADAQTARRDSLLFEAAKANGIEFLYDDIAWDNPAIGLFLKMGFVEVDRTEEIVLLKKALV